MERLDDVNALLKSLSICDKLSPACLQVMAEPDDI